MADLKVTIPLHKAKEICHNISMCENLIEKSGIKNPHMKTAILSLMDEVKYILQTEVRLAEKNEKNRQLKEGGY